jgi:hypothetical protein
VFLGAREASSASPSGGGITSLAFRGNGTQRGVVDGDPVRMRCAARGRHRVRARRCAVAGTRTRGPHLGAHDAGRGQGVPDRRRGRRRRPRHGAAAGARRRSLADGRGPAAAPPLGHAAHGHRGGRGSPVGPGNAAALAGTSGLSSLHPSYRPDEVGSPWAMSQPGYFTDAASQDNIHVAFKQPIDPGWTPPV